MSERLENQAGHPEHLLEVRDLKQYFPIHTGWFQSTPLKAVDGVSFTIDAGETLGLVGESGCGKTTVGRSLLHLYKPTGGEVIYKGVRITPKNISQYRREMQIVFQDPYSSLNPRMTVSDIVGEPLDIHHLYSSKKEREEKIAHLLNLVGLNSDHARRYAHEFSGGQRQRIGIARSRSPHWTCPFRRRSSTPSRSFSRSWAFPTFSLPTTCWWFSISASGSP